MTLKYYASALLFVSAIFAGCFTANAQANGAARNNTGTAAATDTSVTMTVSGETGLKWVNTGITVAAGDTVRLAAEGEIDVGGSYGSHGPEGTTNFSEQPPGYYPVESKLRYGLAARITLGSGRKFLPTQTWIYGEHKEMVVKRSGILWLTVNDDAPEGNVGEFKVTVTVLKKKR
jgi:hypothetical protein